MSIFFAFFILQVIQPQTPSSPFGNPASEIYWTISGESEADMRQKVYDPNKLHLRFTDSRGRTWVPKWRLK